MSEEIVQNSLELEHYGHRKAGIEPIYLELFEEAKRRSELDFESSHKRGKRGVIIGPIDGKFEKHTVKALQSGRRIRTILGGDTSIKIALMIPQEHMEILNNCTQNDEAKYRVACRLWANDTIFDDIIFVKEEYFIEKEKGKAFRGYSSTYWLKALGNYLNAPYEISLFLDSDAYLCPGFHKLFFVVDTKPMNQKYWQFPTHYDTVADFAIGLEQFPNDTGDWKHWIPGDPRLLNDFFSFTSRNTGAVLFNFHRPIAHTFTHFLPLVTQHIYNHVETANKKIVNDQTPFRVALYLFHRLQPDFVEQTLPQHASCRTYPGLKIAGIDGFENGMFPLTTPEGNRCNECHCTPCLVVHTAGTHFVFINKTTGWS